MKSLYPEHRCKCNHLLFKGLILAGSKIEIKCKKCGNIVSLGDSDTANIDTTHFAILFDRNGNIVSESTSTSSILGYNSDELRKMTIFDLSKKSNAHGYSKLWEAITANPEKMFFFDGAFSTKSDHLVDFRCKFRLQKNGNQDFLMVFYSTSEKISNFLPDTTVADQVTPLDFIIEIDRGGTVLYVTRPLSEYLSISQPSEIMGVDLGKLIEIPDLSKFLGTRKNFLLSNRSFIGKKDKKQLIFTPLYNPDNQIKGYKIIVLEEKA